MINPFDSDLLRHLARANLFSIPASSLGFFLDIRYEWRNRKVATVTATAKPGDICDNNDNSRCAHRVLQLCPDGEGGSADPGRGPAATSHER